MNQDKQTVTVEIPVPQPAASVADRSLVKIIQRYDRLSRVEKLEDAQSAVGSGVALPVQYVEDLGHLLRLLGVAI